ncbi:hypothetical protein HPP92_025711 [Vanilla planifolia]|uniref:Uncharacterized protein n=1 Tax=Vanilla planifolia TaxID=51239 RepID=A0A835PK37_VANPL|nr:hypothetical protein HPP92_025711 [Vanilla planifolia]
MARKQSDQGGGGSCRTVMLPLLLALASCILFYTVLSSALRRSVDGSSVAAGGSSVALSGKVGVVVESEEENAKCCRGLEHLELWGSAVKWGTDHSVVIETTRGLSDQLRLRDMGLKEHPRENVEGLLCFGTNVQE